MISDKEIVGVVWRHKINEFPNFDDLLLGINLLQDGQLDKRILIDEINC